MRNSLISCWKWLLNIHRCVMYRHITCTSSLSQCPTSHSAVLWDFSGQRRQKNPDLVCAPFKLGGGFSHSRCFTVSCETSLRSPPEEARWSTASTKCGPEFILSIKMLRSSRGEVHVCWLGKIPHSNIYKRIRWASRTTTKAALFLLWGLALLYPVQSLLREAALEFAHKILKSPEQTFCQSASFSKNKNPAVFTFSHQIHIMF